jgi:hypothetical protein
MNISVDSTQHAVDRMQQRQIPTGIVDFITTFGVSINAGKGARKYVFANNSIKNIRRSYGHGVAKAMSRFMSAYVVEVDGKIITAAFSNRPLLSKIDGHKNKHRRI